MANPYETIESVLRLIKRTLEVEEFSQEQEEDIRFAIGKYGQHEWAEGELRGKLLP